MRFSFPQHNELRGCCWKCLASGIAGSDYLYKHTGLDALWRKHRLSPAQFLANLATAGLACSALLSIPGFSLEFVLLDWLHVVDLGVAADLLGNLFYEVTHFDCPLWPRANSKHYRLDKLWEHLQAWYKVSRPVSRLDNLTFEMFHASKKPKLKAKGAECRYLIPYGAQLACEVASKAGNLHNYTVAALFSKLVSLQRLVSGDLKPFSGQQAALLCRQVCVLYSALHQEMLSKNRPDFWDLKPKVHLFQELVEYQAISMGNPRDFWCYRDESWCGFWARVSKRRGGANSSAMTPERFAELQGS